MSVRLLQKTDPSGASCVPPENCATLENNSASQASVANPDSVSLLAANSSSCDSAPQTPGPFGVDASAGGPSRALLFHGGGSGSSFCSGSGKSRTAERADSFTKLKLSPKAFRFTGKLCRSKSEIERESPDNSYALNQTVEVRMEKKEEKSGTSASIAADVVDLSRGLSLSVIADWARPPRAERDIEMQLMSLFLPPRPFVRPFIRSFLGLCCASALTSITRDAPVAPRSSRSSSGAVPRARWTSRFCCRTAASASARPSTDPSTGTATR